MKIFTSITALSGLLASCCAGMTLDRTGWTVIADAAQPGFLPPSILDGNSRSLYHSPFKPTVAALPHNLTIDMKNIYLINGLTYLPRQDASNNGNIGQYSIDVSTDGLIWTSVNTGNWANDKSLKQVDFSITTARYVRLNALSDASKKNNQFTAVAEINILSDTNRNSSPNIRRKSWKITADSEQKKPNAQSATNAIDGQVTTYWSSAADSTLPLNFTIDMQLPSPVSGLTYLPRPLSTGGKGRIGQYRIESSVDGLSWDTVSGGVWPDTEKLKRVEFPIRSARFFRLIAISEAGNRGPWASAAEINLLDASGQLADFKVTADSFQPGNPPTGATDRDPTTLWHTPFKATAKVGNYPHWYQIDMQTVFGVSGLSYTPRQDRTNNGNIGRHTIEVSMDGQTWQRVSSGKFIDSKTTKLVKFEEIPARYVRLNALSEAGQRGPWAAASDISLSYTAGYTPPPTSLGQWGATINLPVVPVSGAVIYQTGKVLVWSSFGAETFQGKGGRGTKTQTAYFDPSTGDASDREVADTQHDMFCPGTAMDFKGGLVVQGGNSQKKTSLYDVAQNSWRAGAEMKIARGYQSAVTISDGRIFTIGGSWTGGLGGKMGEVYSPDQDTTTLLKNCDQTKMQTSDAAGVYRSDNHAWLFGWKDGYVFQAGPSKKMNWYGTTGDGSTQDAGFRADDGDRMNGIAVMYDAIAGKIFSAGGSPDYTNTDAKAAAHITTIGEPGEPADTEVLQPMNFARAFHSAVVLPDGQVFISGGQSFAQPFTDDNAVMTPELFNPETKTFTILSDMAVPRTYHSIALLMPDATVFVGGGGLCQGCSMNHADAQIFNPPYLFTSQGNLAIRPTITSVSTDTIQVGSSLTVSTDSDVTAFSMIRYGSATHTVNTDQRRIPFKDLTGDSSTGYTLQIPSDAGVAMPGPYMLFALNAAGVPSVSKAIMVTL